MKKLLSFVSVVVLTAAASAASAAPVQLTAAQMDNVTAGKNTVTAIGGGLVIGLAGASVTTGGGSSNFFGTTAWVKNSSYVFGGAAVSAVYIKASN